jgi:hypothetical protein
VNSPNTDIRRTERKRTRTTTAAEELAASYLRELRSAWRAGRDAPGQPVPAHTTASTSRHGGGMR